MTIGSRVIHAIRFISEFILYLLIISLVELKEPDEVESIWNILNCVWLMMGSIMGQGSDILPKYEFCFNLVIN